MCATKTRVHLHELRVRKDGSIFMNASQGFLNVLRTRVGSPAGTNFQIGTFDFHEQKKKQFIGIADEKGPDALREAHLICSHILAIFRSVLLYEAVFTQPGSYNRWITENRRFPTSKDLAEISRSTGIYIPFMTLPYKEQKVNIESLLERATSKVYPRYNERLAAKPAVPQQQASIAKPIPQKSLASPEKLQALLSAFAKN